MTFRYTLSRLERPDARRTFGRAWLWICLAGAAATLIADGARDFFLVVVVWLVCVYAPPRIAAETLQTVGPRWKASLQRDLLARRNRYASDEDIALMVDWFATHDVRAPRMAPRDLALRVTTAATALCRSALRGDGPAGLGRLVLRCAALLDRWAGTIAGGEQVPPPAGSQGIATAAADGEGPAALWEPGASIQDQWGTLRAVAGLAALIKVLVAVYEDAAGAPLEGGAAVRTEAEAAMDYVDQIGLRMEGPPWEEAPDLPRAGLPPAAASRMAATWREFFEAPLPAPRRLAAFVDAAGG